MDTIRVMCEACPKNIERNIFELHISFIAIDYLGINFLIISQMHFIVCNYEESSVLEDLQCQFII